VAGKEGSSGQSRADAMAIDHFDPMIAQRAFVRGLGTTLPTGEKWDEKY
jgi:hypothetical protein